ncbi:TRAP transporter large permease [Natronorarus salvus]|uniref:TRAP transporter large permease n=1 Tax=Natronorarus salvus TaxID=3117733 RepID=UPI002F26ACA8
MDTMLLLGLMVLLLVFIFSRVEIAFTLGMVGFVFLLIADQSLVTGISRAFGGLNRFVLLAIPFFLLAGELMNQSGITERLIEAANVTVGRVRGGLAQANVVASLLFSGLTGAAVADVAALGSIFVPSMAAEGYDRDFSAAVTAASSLVGPIIPPSIIIVIYGAVTQTSIGALFAAAIIPGLILGLSIMVLISVIAVRKDLPRYEVEVTRKEYPALIFHSLLALTMPAIILIGITGGYMTPTEAAAVASAYAFFLGTVVYRSLTYERLQQALELTLERTAQLYIIIGFAMILTWVIAREGVTRDLAEGVAALGLGPLGFMIIISLILLFVGTWLEIGAATIMLAPTIHEMAQVLGIHEFQFGIMFIVTLNFGLITPPVGICLFAASSVSRVPVWPIAKKIVPFFVVDIIVLALLIYFPQLTLWLPETLGYL